MQEIALFIAIHIGMLKIKPVQKKTKKKKQKIAIPGSYLRNYTVLYGTCRKKMISDKAVKCVFERILI